MYVLHFCPIRFLPRRNTALDSEHSDPISEFMKVSSLALEKGQLKAFLNSSKKHWTGAISLAQLRPTAFQTLWKLEWGFKVLLI